MLLVLCMMAASHMAGGYLYRQSENKAGNKETKTDTEDAEETAETSSVKEAVSGKAERTENRIVLDSGHGGSDPGKIGINDALEKEINLAIAKKVKAYLEEQNVEVIMTRTDENSLAESKTEDMKKRVAIINEQTPYLAVSIHQNSYPEESIQGAQVFYYTHSDEGKKAAEILQEALLKADTDNTRQAKANDTYYMLRRTEVPTVIVECGFLSNLQEAELLTTETYQDKMAAAICEGILQYLSSASRTAE